MAVHFLTKLTRPKLWDGYSFLLSVAVGDAEENLICVVSGYDAAGVLISTVNSDPISATNQVIDFNIPYIYGSVTPVTYFSVYVKDTFDEVKTDVINIDVVSPCSNAIMLLGRNSLGGALQWLFSANQDVTFEPQGDEKAKRVVMSDGNVNINQWTALHDFITFGSAYRNSIPEFLSTTNKTSSRIGQQIYVLSTSNTKIGVIAMPTKNVTQTKRIQHFFELEIEYPSEFAV